MNNLVNCYECKFINDTCTICNKYKVRIYQNLNNPNYDTENFYYPCLECNGRDFKPRKVLINMKFELGKYYKHSTGTKLYICGLGETYYHGRCFIGENEYGELSPIGNTEENAVNYIEITKEEFVGGVR